MRGKHRRSVDAVADDGPVAPVHHQGKQGVDHVVVGCPAAAGPVVFAAPGGELDLQERALLGVWLGDVDDQVVREDEPCLAWLPSPAPRLGRRRGPGPAGSVCDRTEMTAASNARATRGASRPVAELVVYRRAPGTVVRCRTCGSVLMVLVRRTDATSVDLSGLADSSRPGSGFFPVGGIQDGPDAGRYRDPRVRGFNVHPMNSRLDPRHH
jgi:Family of unknown function (DUF6510)